MLAQPAHRPVPVPDRVLDDVGHVLVHRGGELEVGPEAVLGKDEVVEHHLVPHERAGGIPGELLDHVADELVVVRRLGAAAVHRTREVGDQRAMALLADAQRGGVRIALGVVADVHDDTVDRRIVEMARRHELDRDPVTVGVADAHRVRGDVVGLGDGAQHLRRREVEIVRVHQLERVHALQLLGRVTEETVAEWHLADHALLVDDDQRVARVLDQRVEARLALT